VSYSTAPASLLISARMNYKFGVAGFADVAAPKEILIAEARYVPNTQFLSIPFRSELIHEAA